MYKTYIFKNTFGTFNSEGIAVFSQVTEHSTLCYVLVILSITSRYYILPSPRWYTDLFVQVLFYLRRLCLLSC